MKVGAETRLGIWECPKCATIHYNITPETTPIGAQFIHCTSCKKKTAIHKTERLPINMVNKKKKRTTVRSIIKVEDPKRKIFVTITVDDKGHMAENAGALCRITNEVSDTMRKLANAHEVKVIEYGKVLKK